MSRSVLFEPMTLREVELRNRIAVSPMCQYSSENGFANDWHLTHLGSRAVGGAGLVFTEATAVTPAGRISPADLGLWEDGHVDFLRRITRFVSGQGAVAGIQLAHAGRKASTAAPWNGGGPITVGDGGWQTVAPSALPFQTDWPTPRELDEPDIRAIASAFRDATVRAKQAGFRVLEVHAAHGYLIHEFLSPLTNRRTDGYGGPFENRTRLILEIVAGVREVWPEGFPLFVRISATDWVEGGWDLEQSVELARRLGPLGVDVVDCSSGGIVPDATIPVGPGFQVPFAREIRKRGATATAAVGVIREPREAEEILIRGDADLVLLARQFLREPYWPLRAARELGVPLEWPVQYKRAAD
jgi:2,4-dienoyl-CoA reductase-like NADH-dependent reductase (Old Yellow Enzyme family)